MLELQDFIENRTKNDLKVSNRNRRSDVRSKIVQYNYKFSCLIPIEPK